MTTITRSARRTSYPALMVFGIVYLATLAIIISPQSFRGGPHPMIEAGLAPSQTTERTP